MNNVANLADDNLIEPKPDETNPGNRGGGGDSNIDFRRSQRERRPPKYLEDYETRFDEYRNDVEKGPKGGVVS